MVDVSAPTPTAEYNSLTSEISKTERAIKNFAKQGQSDRANQLTDRLQTLQEARSNLVKTGLAYTTPKPTDSLTGKGLVQTGANSYATGEAIYAQRVQSLKQQGVSTSKEYFDLTKGSFVNQQGQGFSAAPSITPINIRDVGYGRKQVTYADQSKGIVETGTVNIYGKEKSVSSPELQRPSTKSNLVKGIENVSAYESGLLAQRKEMMRAADIQKKSVITNPEFIVSEAKLGVIGASKLIYPIAYPRETAKGLISSIKQPVQTVKGLIYDVKSNPVGTLGSFYGTGKLLKSGEGVVSVGREASIGLIRPTVKSSKYIEPKLAKSVEQGNKAFPTSKSMKEVLSKFNVGKTPQGTIKVLSASPTPIKTLGQSRLIAIGKGTGKDRTEGLYAASFGKGSPFFFRLVKPGGKSYSILPKLAISKPTLSVIEVKGVKRIPQSVLSKGVSTENLYLQVQAGKGYAFTTGNIERRFNPNLPKGFKTSETEVVIPTGSIIKQSKGGLIGFTESFKFKDRRVLVKEYKLSYDTSKVSPNIKLNLKNPFKSEGSYKVKGSSVTYYAPKENVSLIGSYLRGSIGKSSISKSNIFSSKYLSSSSKPLSYSSKYVSSNLAKSYKPLSISSPKIFKSYSSVKYSSKPSYSLPEYKASSSVVSINNYKQPSTKNINIKDSNILSIGRKVQPSTFRSSSFKGYTPSIEASYFNIKGKKVSKSLAQSGLVLRPIVR